MSDINTQARVLMDREVVETAPSAQDASTDTMDANQEALAQKQIADLYDAYYKLAMLFDIDIESVNPDEEPIKFAVNTFLRDACYQTKRNIDYNEKALADKAVMLQGMVSRFDGSERADTSIQNVSIVLRGLEDQLDLWKLAHQAACEAHYELTGNEWKPAGARSSVDNQTAATEIARELVAKYAPSQSPVEQAQADAEHWKNVADERQIAAAAE
tara:strand:- start:93 stop:737 length:645 start_codon:yes stop_codon:yes gene_type:complete